MCRDAIGIQSATNALYANKRSISGYGGVMLARDQVWRV